MNRLSYHLSFYSVLFFAFFSHGHRVVAQSLADCTPAFIIAHIGEGQFPDSDPGTSSILQAIFNNYDVHTYTEAFPGLTSEYLENSRMIVPEDRNNLSALKLDLEQSNIFDLVEIECEFELLNKPLLVPEGYEYHPEKLLHECSDPVEVNDAASLRGNYLNEMELPCAWTITEGSSNISVGIPDSYFDFHHDELDGKLISIGLSCDPALSQCDHGFGVAGHVAAIHNTVCVAGAGNKTRVRGYCVGVTDCSRIMGVHTGVAQAFADGNQIINVSATGIGITNQVRMAVENITRNGVTLVVGAYGNSHANYVNIPGVINVAMLLEDRNYIIYNTNTTQEFNVDIGAPVRGTGGSEDIWKLDVNNGCRQSFGGGSIIPSCSRDSSTNVVS